MIKKVYFVTKKNREEYSADLEDMYRMRYRAAVQEMGWSIEADSNGRDVDCFDYPDTVYALYYNLDGSVGACGRLNPTTRPHLMSKVFPNLCVEGVPTGPKIWEFSRGLVERRGKTQREYMTAWMLINQAMNEYCIDHDILEVSWLSRKRLYSLSTMLWDTKPLGLPRYYEDDKKEYIAAISKFDMEGLHRVQNYSKIKYRVGQYQAIKNRAEGMKCAS